MIMSFSSSSSSSSSSARSVFERYDQELLSLIGDLIFERCEGCKINHPSQEYHDCLTAQSPRSCVEDDFETAWARLDHAQLMSEYKKEVLDWMQQKVIDPSGDAQ